MLKKFLIMIGFIAYGNKTFATLDDWSHENFVLARASAHEYVQSLDKCLEKKKIYCIPTREKSIKPAEITVGILSKISKKLSLAQLEKFINKQASSSDARKTYFDAWMKVQEISAEDPRPGLRGQRGVFAKKDIPPGTPLGIYPGVWYIHQIHDGINSDEIAEWEWLNQKGSVRYSDMVRYQAGFKISKDQKMILGACGHLSPMALINSIDPNAGKETKNTNFHLFMRKGELPFSVYFSDRKIKKGEEILAEYTDILKQETERTEALSNLKKALKFETEDAAKEWAENILRDYPDPESVQKALSKKQFKEFNKYICASLRATDFNYKEGTKNLTPEGRKIYDFKGQEILP
jgi:hypothetical protein